MLIRLIAGIFLVVALIAVPLGLRAYMRPTSDTGAMPGGDPDIPIGDPLYSAKGLAAPLFVGDAQADEPLVIPGCRLVVFEKVEVPSRRDGVLLCVGTDIEPGATVPEDLLVEIELGGEKKRYRRLREGDTVKAGQLLAQLDDSLARDDCAIKHARVVAAEADLVASEKAREEARARYDVGVRLASSKGMSSEEVRERKLVLEKVTYEAVSKQEAVKLGRFEETQSKTVLAMHEIRSSIDGVIKTIYRNPGEAVKGAPSFEPVFLVLNPKRIRAEGLIGEQDLPLLKSGDEVTVEMADVQRAQHVFVGHLQEVTGIAVTRDSKRIVSASTDGTLRVWGQTARRELRVLKHPTGVTCVACAPAGSGPDLCLAGLADGSVWLWDLGSDADAPLWKSGAEHAGAVTCIAFGPDGAVCASGGEDRMVRLWDTADGKPKYQLQGHSGAVTNIQFTPQARLVSASQDNTLRLWSMGTLGGRLQETIDRRSGDVAQLGVHPDGRHVLFDPWQSPYLRILELPGGRTEAVLQPSSGDARCTTFALFSPDARTVATGGMAEGVVQMWSLPAPGRRAHLRRLLVTTRNTPPTCAAFAPDGSFLTAGTPTRNVFVWSLRPSTDEATPLKARVTHIERTLDSRQIRVWAEIPNPGGRLLPGASVTLVHYPR